MIKEIKERGLHNVKFCSFKSTSKEIDFYIVDKNNIIIYISKQSKAHPTQNRDYMDKVGSEVTGYMSYTFKEMLDKYEGKERFLEELGITEDEYPEYFI